MRFRVQFTGYTKDSSEDFWRVQERCWKMKMERFMWHIRQQTHLAGEKGLRLIGEIEFHKWAFPGYSNKKGGGSNCNSTFPIVKASTFMFKI